MTLRTQPAALSEVTCDYPGCPTRKESFGVGSSAFLAGADFWNARRREGWVVDVDAHAHYCPTHAGEASA